MNISRLVFLFLIFNLFSLTNAYSVGTFSQKANTAFLQKHYGVSDLESFVGLRAKELRGFKDERISFKERIVLKLMQREVKKQLRNQEVVNIELSYITFHKNASIVGFLLGFALGLIGVLIAYGISREHGNASWGGLAALFLLLLVFYSVLR